MDCKNHASHAPSTALLAAGLQEKSEEHLILRPRVSNLRAWVLVEVCLCIFKVLDRSEATALSCHYLWSLGRTSRA